MIWPNKAYSFAAFWAPWMWHVPHAMSQPIWTTCHGSPSAGAAWWWGLWAEAVSETNRLHTCSTLQIVACLSHTIYLLPHMALRSTNTGKGQVCSTTWMSQGSVDGGYSGKTSADVRKALENHAQTGSMLPKKGKMLFFSSHALLLTDRATSCPADPP